MSSQLEQLLGYLERDGVTEVIVGSNKPVVMRTARGVTNLTARPLSNEQLATILRGTEIDALIPRSDGDSAPREVQIGRRRALAVVTRLADTITISLSRCEPTGVTLPTQPMARVATPVAPPSVTFSKSASPAPRTKAPSAAPRSKTASAAPRTKSASTAPRTKRSTAAPKDRTSTATRMGTPVSPIATANTYEALSLADDGIELGALAGGLEIDRGPAPAVASPPQRDAAGSFDAIDLGMSLELEDMDARPGLQPASPHNAPAAYSASQASQHNAAAPYSPPQFASQPPQHNAAAPYSPPQFASQPPSAPHQPAHYSPPQFASRPPQHNATAPYSPPQFASQPASAPHQPAHYSPPQFASQPASAPHQPAHHLSPQFASQPAHHAPAPRLAARESARADSGAFGAIVRSARERGASDLHVAAARVTSIRLDGELVPLDPDASPLTADAAAELLLPLLDDALRAQLDRSGYVDLALDAPDGGRLRANISRQQQGLKGTFRLALAAPATLEQLGLPADLAKVVHHHQGLIVIAGPSGHGKTTTLAAFVDLLNSSRPYHILTIEDPIEIVHPRKQAVISQREAGRHTQSFARGLKASLREDPDVIVIGELRDRESVEIALTAAETGHLVIATMSTPSAAKTIDRLIDMFPPEDHSQVRASVAGALRAIVAQRLLPRRGGGVVPAVELVTGVLPLAVMIREDKLYQLPNLMQRGRAFGMIRFDESLAELVRSGRLDEDAALAVAESKKDLAATLHPAAAAPAPQAKTSPLWGFGKKEQR